MKKLLFTIMAIVAMATVTANAGVIYSDDFSGGTGDINGTTPDVSATGATWVAAPIFNQDGSIDPDNGSMTLAFTPENGQIYTLDASLRGVTAPQNDLDWLALGFARGQDDTINANSRFTKYPNVVGQAWMLFRGDLGAGYLNKTHYAGTANPVDWTALTDLTTDVDMRVVLDTTGGDGAWTATWYAKAPADSDYAQVGGPTVLPVMIIDSVGIAISSSDVDGTVTSFSLTSVPEPATLALLGLGGLVLRRRR